MARDAGQAGLWTLWAASVLFAAAAASLGWGGALAARQQAESAADLSALAGAAAQLRGGDPCGAAAEVAQAQGARLAACGSSAGALTVEVTVALPRVLRGLDVPPARARARAGVAP